MKIKMKTIRKIIYTQFRLYATLVIVVKYYRLIVDLEYLPNLSVIDNRLGRLPFILLTGVCVLLLVLVWRKYQELFQRSTVVFAIVALLGGILLIPAVDGSFYPAPPVVEADPVALDLSSYEPFSEETKLASLEEPATLTIDTDLPRLDGDPGLYPLYAAVAQALYDEESYSSDVVTYSSKTEALQALISGEREIIFISGWIPREQEEEAWKAGVELSPAAVGQEFFVFLANAANPINNLTSQQIENIYSRKTTKWKTLGWEDGGDILAYQGTAESEGPGGLQILLRGYAPHQNPYYLPEDEWLEAGSLIKQLAADQNGLGYTRRFYAQTMYPNEQVKMLKIDGMYPSNEAMRSDNYSFDDAIIAVTNGEPTGNAKQLIDWMRSEEGQRLIEKSGYALGYGDYLE